MFSPYLQHTNVKTCYPIINVKIFLKEANWDWDNMPRYLLENVINYVILHMDHAMLFDNEDKLLFEKN